MTETRSEILRIDFGGVDKTDSRLDGLDDGIDYTWSLGRIEEYALFQMTVSRAFIG